MEIRIVTMGLYSFSISPTWSIYLRTWSARKAGNRFEYQINIERSRSLILPYIRLDANEETCKTAKCSIQEAKNAFAGKNPPRASPKRKQTLISLHLACARDWGGTDAGREERFRRNWFRGRELMQSFPRLA